MFRKKNSNLIITTRELADYIVEKRVIPVPKYTEKKERALIVVPRGTIYGQKPKKKNRIKL